MQPSLIQASVQKPEAQTIPEQQLQPIPAAVAEDKGMAAKGIRRQDPLHLGGQAIKAQTHPPVPPPARFGCRDSATWAFQDLDQVLESQPVSIGAVSVRLRPDNR